MASLSGQCDASFVALSAFRRRQDSLYSAFLRKNCLDSSDDKNRSRYMPRPTRMTRPHPEHCAPQARTSDALPAYRAALFTKRGTRATTTAPSTNRPSPDEKAEFDLEMEGLRHGKKGQKLRYEIRMAEGNELYTVADIRCEAFYGHPKDPYYYPVRRREIYMAMRDRIESGNKCFVVIDTEPPEGWQAFANNGRLVVGSLDVSLHKVTSGRRCKFGSLRDSASCEDEDDGRRIYISSMAVREQWQGQGLAQRLLAHVDALASLHRIREVFLHVEWENEAAVHVYTKCGFICVEEQDPSRVPRWLHFLAKREHKLMRKRYS